MVGLARSRRPAVRILRGAAPAQAFTAGELAYHRHALGGPTPDSRSGGASQPGAGGGRRRARSGCGRDEQPQLPAADDWHSLLASRQVACRGLAPQDPRALVVLGLIDL